MRIPKLILERIRKTESLRRYYPKERPNLEQVTVLLELAVLEGKSIGFLVSRHLMRPTGNPKEFILETSFHENYYEPRELVEALADYKKDIMPDPSPTPFQKFVPRPWQKAPRLTLEKKPIPKEEPKKKEPSDKEKRILYAQATGQEIGIGDLV